MGKKRIGKSNLPYIKYDFKKKNGKKCGISIDKSLKKWYDIDNIGKPYKLLPRKRRAQRETRLI